MLRKVLVIITTEFTIYSGIAVVMMNYYRNMDKSGLQIDFASTNKAPNELIDELSANGSNYYCLGARRKQVIPHNEKAHVLYKINLKEFFDDITLMRLYKKNLGAVLNHGNYDVIHVHGNSTSMCIELATAKKYGVKKRIAHVHNSQTSFGLVRHLNMILRHYFTKLYTCALAVSSDSGDYLYGKNAYMILNNAIDLERYKFQPDCRLEYKKSLFLENAFVIGHIGKLNAQKNQMFLLEVFEKVKKHQDNAVLLLVGKGMLENDLKRKCEELGISDSVIFLGVRDDVENILQVMDLFVFPSVHEGFPLCLIEAQANGLPCLASDAITMDAKFADNVIYKPLKDGVESWANEILYMMDKGCGRNPNASEDVRAHGFDIKQEAKKLRNLYLQNIQGMG